MAQLVHQLADQSVDRLVAALACLVLACQVWVCLVLAC